MKLALPRLRRDARIRLTKAGWLYAASTLGIGLAAVNTGDNLLYLVTSFLLAVMATASLWAWLNFSGLSARLEVPPHAFRDRPLHAELVLVNAKPIPSFLIHATPRAEPGMRPRLRQTETEVVDTPGAWVFRIPRKGGVVARIRLRFLRRGLVDLTGLRVRSAFPFGLAYREEILPLPRGRVVVFPAIHPVQGEPPDRFVAQSWGDENTRREGTGGDFLGLRSFVRGDSPRRIYWRAFFKEGSLQVKRFAEEASRTVILHVPRGAQEQDLEEVASWIVHLLQDGHRVGLTVEDTGEAFEPGTGEAHRHLLLRALALYPHPLGITPAKSRRSWNG